MQALRIWIDGNEANTRERVGSNVFAYELLKALKTHSLSHKFKILLSSPPVADMPKSNANWRYHVVKPQKLWTQWALPQYLYAHQDKFDVFFTPGHYAPRSCPKPYISSVMDTAYLSHPLEFNWFDRTQLRHWTKYSVNHARKVLCISQATQESVNKYYPSSAGKTFVAYPGCLDLNPLATSSTNRYLHKIGVKDAPFFIHIGTIQPRKRIITLIDAFDSLNEELSQKKESGGYRTKTKLAEPHLIIVGKVGWLAQSTVDRVKQSPFEKQIHLTNFIDDELKLGLLKKAQALIAVGEAEGFGIPVLEALQLGTIPIVSNVASLPEVCGPAGIIIKKNSATHLTRALNQALWLTTGEKRSLKKLGFNQANKFSWDESAKILVSQLREIHS